MGNRRTTTQIPVEAEYPLRHAPMIPLQETQARGIRERGANEEKEEVKMYSQTELIGVPKEKRGLLNWIKQMDYSGPTFFHG